MRFLEQFIKLALNVVAMTMLALTILYCAIKAPEIHNKFLRLKVGSVVYTMSKPDGYGTGFAIKAKSGNTVIITNDHVCLGTVGNLISVTNERGYTVARKILKRSAFSDLCVVEAMPGVIGLTLGNEPRVGDTVYALGHPLTRPLTIEKGELIGIEPIVDMVEERELKCTSPKYYLKQNTYIIPNVIMIPLLSECHAVTKNVYNTTMVVYPGSSGSPMVDVWGKVQGVVFANDNESDEAYAVNYQDLENTLNEF